MCEDKSCKTCPVTGKELFAKLVIFLECSTCNSGYSGENGGCLNIRNNGHCSDIKDLNTKNCSDS